MLKSAIGPEFYTDEEIFALECERIFGKLWLFAGFADFVQGDKKFLTRTFGRVPVFVTRAASGELVAFENLCPHRQMPLFIEDFGKKGLFCPYHGWAFNDDGSLRRIPNPEIYKFSEQGCSELHLRRLAVTEIGRFIFVNLSSSPLPIEAQFTQQLLESLVDVSQYLGDQIGYSRFEAPYNWKLNFENVKDWNHVPFLHSQSFAPLLETSNSSPQDKANVVSWETDWADRYVDDAELSELSYHQSSPMKRATPWYDGQLERYRGEDRYYNWFLYPNINFTSIHGELFQVQQFNPVAANKTEYNLWVMSAKKKTKALNLIPLIAALLQIEKATIEEDRVYLDRMQEKLHKGGPKARHGHYELHIKRMNDWYFRAMS